MARQKDESNRIPPLSDSVLDRIDHAWDALERGEIELASTEAEELMEETEGHPEVRFLMGAALFESGYPTEALVELQSSEGRVDSPNVHIFYLASTMLELARFEEAEKLFLQVLEIEEDKAPVQYGLAQVLEHLGRYAEAEPLYEEAFRSDPESYPLPTRMQRDAFEKVVREAAECLPEELTRHLSEVAIVVQDLPSRDVLVEAGGETITPTVLGLFVGRNLREASVFDPPALPPTIFIYQRNLERLCQTREDLINEIRMTLYHELGHYLGLEEDELEARGLE
ncbi:MAG: metallopeptidase family protein [Candidatus Eisenbacteria bacterium]|nr:metallopeptidase family protein [Candidatus Eisenbacteria bacterium]